MLLVAAMNPCKCTPADLQQHAARVSGPVPNRIDLQIGRAHV